MNFWIDKLDKLVAGEDNVAFFQGLNRKESVLVCVKNIWNDKFNRLDTINFDLKAFVSDPNGKESEEPPHIITRQMGLEDIELRKTGLENFKKLLK